MATIAGVIFQGPIGYFSDKYERRRVIVITTLFGALFAFIAIIFGGWSMSSSEIMIMLQKKNLLQQECVYN